MTTLTAALTITYEITYNRWTHDYDCVIRLGDDPMQYIGSRANYRDAETLCVTHKRDLLNDGALQTATALDGGSDQDEIAAEYAEALELAPHLRERTCEGLQFPCDKPVTHCIPIDLGRDGDKQINSSLKLCDEHAAEWQSWNPPPSGLPGPCPPPADDEEDDGATCARFSTPLALVTDPPVTLPSDCWGYADTCHNPATQILIVVVSDAAEIALCDACAAKWRKLHVVLPPVCGNCDKPHHIQRCPEVWRALTG